MTKRKRPPDIQSQKITDFFKPKPPVQNDVTGCPSVQEAPASTTPPQKTSSSAPITAQPEPRAVKHTKKHQRLTTPPRRSCNKTRLKTYLRTDQPSSAGYEANLLDYISKPHQLARHATEFIKFWFLSATDYPHLTESHVEGILYMLNKGPAWNPTSETKLSVKAEILPFIQPYQTLRQLRSLKMDHDQQPINYLAKSIFANVKTNVQEHYMQMLLRFINLRIGRFGPLIQIALVNC
jgi:hypothetical protein